MWGLGYMSSGFRWFQMVSGFCIKVSGFWACVGLCNRRCVRSGSGFGCRRAHMHPCSTYLGLERFPCGDCIRPNKNSYRCVSRTLQNPLRANADTLSLYTTVLCLGLGLTGAWGPKPFCRNWSMFDPYRKNLTSFPAFFEIL